MAQADTSGTILARTGELMRANAALALFVIVGLGVLDTVLEISVERQSFAISGVMTVIAQYAVSVAALRKLGLVGDDERGTRLLPLFGLAILIGLATLLGLVLLIIPGVIVAVRLWIAAPILLVEQVTVTAAMQRSWERTADRFWPIFGVFAIYIAATVAAVVVPDLAFEGSFVGALAMKLVINTATVATWYAAIAVYEHTRPAPKELEEVFA